jgi:hypothetical protein
VDTCFIITVTYSTYSIVYPLLQRHAPTTILLDPILVEFFDFEGDLPCGFLRKKRERESEEGGPKALVLPLQSGLKQILVK